MTTNTIEKDFFLTPHFSLKEMTSSVTATQLHITNCPNTTQIARLKALCNHVLEPLRNRFGAIRITSGFRSEPLNSALCANSLSQTPLARRQTSMFRTEKGAWKCFDLYVNTARSTSCCWRESAKLRRFGYMLAIKATDAIIAIWRWILPSTIEI